eukprot:Polyplicarium_translucidae@DN427_c0_g1_i1.p2
MRLHLARRVSRNRRQRRPRGPVSKAVRAGTALCTCAAVPGNEQGKTARRESGRQKRRPSRSARGTQPSRIGPDHGSNYRNWNSDDTRRRPSRRAIISTVGVHKLYVPSLGRCSDKSRHTKMSDRPDRHDESNPREFSKGFGTDAISRGVPGKIYIGNLPPDCAEDELRKEFREFGRVLNIEAKGRFAFVEYESEREAARAMREMDGARFLGDRISVQPHRPGLRAARWPPSHQVCPPERRQGPKPTGREQRTEHRIIIFDLDERVSWQDLKDFGRNVGDVNFANVFSRNGRKVGVIEYFDAKSMQRALEKLDGMRLYDQRVTVEEDVGQLEPRRRTRRDDHRGDSRSRSRSRSPRGDYHLERGTRDRYGGGGSLGGGQGPRGGGGVYRRGGSRSASPVGRTHIPDDQGRAPHDYYGRRSDGRDHGHHRDGRSPDVAVRRDR